MFKGRFKSVSRKFQECFKEVSRVCQGSLGRCPSFLGEVLIIIQNVLGGIKTCDDLDDSGVGPKFVKT